jgi:mycobactin lysine-N-oxygenase
VAYGGLRQAHAFDYVVVAVGFDPLGFVNRLSERARDRLQAAAAALTPGAIEAAVGYDLGIRGLTPRLHLPMLSGVIQGPGFPNLSCLGLLAERILAAYTPPASGGPAT